MIKSATFSKCRKYRYTLRREWDDMKGFVTFIGLNPSTADETEDDPTIRRCVGFARAWGYGGVSMVNLFAFRATEPKDMKRASDPIGEQNELTLKMASAFSDIVIAAWGNDGSFMNQDKVVRKLIHPEKLHYLKLNATGQPAHPLYQPKDLVPVRWKVASGI